MIVALYAFAVAMILGGAAALIQGYGIVMVERGWTLVIAGAVAIGSGAVLAGIAYAASLLGAIQADLAKLRERFARLDPATLPAGPTIGTPGLAPAPRGPAELPPAPAPEPAEAVEERPSAPARPAIPARPARPEPVLGGVPLRGAAPPLAEEAESAPPQPVDLDEPSPAPPGPPTVVGSYESGGNRYVMFSDGSIEAETPNGVFRFKSLDELKEFIASGGEGGPVPG